MSYVDVGEEFDLGRTLVAFESSPREPEATLGLDRDNFDQSVSKCYSRLQFLQLATLRRMFS